MNIKRIVRDLLILVIFCGGFFLLTKAVNLFGSEENTAATVSEYSYDRVQGDFFFTKRRYLSAAEHYQKLVVADPDNGHAWYHLAMCYENIRYRFRFESWRKKLAIKDRPNATLDPRVPGWEKTAAEYGDRAIEPFKKCLDFHRYRDIARLNLAEIYAAKGDNDMAFKYLNNAFDDGYFTKEGLANIFEFASLRGNAEFQQLNRRDQHNRRMLYSQNNSVKADVGQ